MSSRRKLDPTRRYAETPASSSELEGESARLTRGSIGRVLVAMTIPSVVGGIGLLSVFVVDAYFVGRLGTDALAIFGFAFPVVLGLMYLAIGLGTGAAAAVGRMLGEGEFEGRRRMATNALLLAQAVMGLVWLAIATADSRLFSLLGAPPSLDADLRAYMSVVAGALWIFSIGVVAGAIMRAHGDAKTPAVAMGLCSAVNLICDPVLIFGFGPIPALGVPGAGWATAAGAIVGVAISLQRMRSARELASIPQALTSWRRDWWRVLRVAGPAGGVQLLTPFSQIVMTRLVAGSGPAAVAAVGVGMRIEVLAMVVLIALSTTLSSFVSQNWGAGHRERVYRAIFHSLHFGFAWMAFLFLVTHLWNREIGALFSDEPEVLDVLSIYVAWVLPTAGFAGLVMLIFGVLNALEKPIEATSLSLVRVCIFFIPCAYLGYESSRTLGLFLGIGIANATAGTLVYLAVRRVVAQRRSLEFAPAVRAVGP